MKNIYSGGERGYLTKISNAALARVREAKSEIRKHYPLVMISLASCIASAAAFGIGLEGICEQRFSNSNEVQIEDTISDSSMDILLYSSLALNMVSLLTFIKSIKDIKRRKAVLNENIETLSKYLLYDNVFTKFLFSQNIPTKNFSGLSTPEKIDIIDNFLQNSDINVKIHEMS